ncbi:hypothetical protein F5H01DRAFT_67159 [Linnemannia elongata]|nr:hypothetical protein F5H01DRAFT_67159 [Linnemannia elongata]
MSPFLQLPLPVCLLFFPFSLLCSVCAHPHPAYLSDPVVVPLSCSFTSPATNISPTSFASLFSFLFSHFTPSATILVTAVPLFESFLQAPLYSNCASFLQSIPDNPFLLPHPVLPFSTFIISHPLFLSFPFPSCHLVFFPSFLFLCFLLSFPFLVLLLSFNFTPLATPKKYT